MIGHSLRLHPLTSGIWTSHLRAPSAWRPVHPFVRYSSGTDRAPLVHAVTAKLLVYGFVFITPPSLIVLVTLRPPSTLTVLLAFTPPVTLQPLSTFATCLIKFRLAVHPCPRVTTVPTLVLFCLTVSHIRGIVGVWLKWHFGPLSLFPV